MANFNGEKWISDAIRSVQQQSLQDWELIVVDDASTDASVEIVRTFANQDGRIVLLTSSFNGGPSSARNQALACARARWITLLDSDDLLEKERLSSLLRNAETYGEGVIADDLLIMDESGFLTGASLLALKRSTTFDAVSLVREPRLAYLKPMINADLLDQFWYNEGLRSGEDFDLLLRVLARHDTRIVVFPSMGYRYRRRGGSLSTDKSADRRALRGMLEANSSFRASFPLPETLAAACARRDRSLKASLHWVDVTESIREGHPLIALKQVIDHPLVMSCAVQALKKRLLLLFHSRRSARTLGL